MTKNQHDTIRSHPAYSLHPKFFGCAVASLTLVVGLSAAGPVAAQTVAGGAYQQQYEWTQPTAEEVHLRLIAWMQDQDVDVDVEAAVNDLWPEDLASMPGDALLDRLAQSIAVVDERAAALAEVCLAPRQGLALPEVAWLAGDDPFFGAREVVEHHRRSLESLRDALLDGAPGLVRVEVYGELFGGLYPHPEVQAQPGRPVQDEVCYCPEVRFLAFDLAVVDASGGRAYRPFAEALERFAAHGVPAIEVLSESTYAAAMAYPVEFPSTLPERFGLPPLRGAPLAEGVVVRPARTVEVEGRRGRVRPLMKRKREGVWG